MTITDKIDAITKITEKYLGTIIPAPKSVKIELTANCLKQVRELIAAYCDGYGGDGCWLWTRSLRGKGYAQLTLRGRRQVNGSRAAYLAFKGEIPTGMIVCHTCDTPRCCNPTHLFVGSHKDNTQDCVKKGRLRPQNGGKASARIKPEARQRIKSLYEAGRLQREIAAEYGVSQVCISQILRGKRVNHGAH